MECFLCDREWTIKAFDTDNNECYFCEVCAKKLLDEDNWVMYKWELYSWFHQDVTPCRWCWHPVHKDQAAIQDWRCINCQSIYFNLKNNTDAKAHYCCLCDAIHPKWMCPTGLHDEVVASETLSFSVRNQDKNWYIKWDATDKSSYVKTIWQFQTERELRDEDKDMLDRFYRWYKKFTHYYTREPVNIEWEVSYYNYELVKKVKRRLEWLRYDARDYIEDCIKVSKYYNYYIKGNQII